VHVPGLEETMTRPTADGSAPLVPSEEQELLGALRRGDGAAFARLVETLHGSMLRLAMLQQLDRFEGRSSLKACQLLGLTQGNQRVLLHRGRSKVRATLEHYLDAASMPS
jgi:RNA polymerase sigma-70 factor, ECF subfamily